MKKSIKSIALGATALLVLSLAAGCSGSSKTDTSSAASPSPNATDNKPVTITFKSWWAYVNQPIIDQFQKENPNIKVNWEYVPPGDTYQNKIRALASSNDLPDVFGIQGDVLTEMIKAGKIKDLHNDLATKSYDQKSNWGDSFNSILLDGVNQSLPADLQDPNKNYGVPFGTISLAVIYNKNIFDKVGISEPKNWNDFMSNNAKLKAAGYIPLSFVNKGAAWGTWYRNLVMDQTMRDVTPDDFLNGKIKYTDPKMKKAFQIVKDMWDQGDFSPSALTDGIEDDQNLFVKGKLAQFLVVPENFVTYLVDNSPKDVKLGSFVFPAAEGVQPSRTLGGSSNIVVINKDSKNQEAALKFAKYLTSQEIFQELAPQHVVPSIKGYQPPKDDPIMGTFAQAAQNGFITPHTPNIGADFNNLMNNEVYPQVLTGQISIDDAMNKLQNSLDQYMKAHPKK